jgi:hypothetical protein
MTFPLRKVIDFAMQKPAEVDEAYRQFFGALPFSELKQEWEELFLEWLIFDFKHENKPTFLVLYILKNPDGIDKNTLDQFEQIAETDFYSNFEIRKIKQGEWFSLEDLFTGKIYTVYDKKGSESVRGRGTIPGRIAQVDDKWYLVGANSVYFPITYTERAKKHMRKLKMKNFSPRDTVELLRSQEQTPHAPISVPTNRELEEKRKSLKAAYTKIAKKFDVTLSFDDLIKEIYDEKRENVLDFWKELEKKGLRYEILIEDIKLLQDIWNYFPHKCLNDLSPIETFAKFKEKGSG